MPIGPLWAAAVLAAPVQMVPDELADVRPRVLFRYRARRPLVVVDVFAQLAAERAARLERALASQFTSCVFPSSGRLDWDDEIRASVDEIR